MLSLVAMWMIFDGVQQGANGRMAYLVGVHHPRPHLLSIDRASLSQTGVKTVVKLAPDLEDPWRAVAVVYFKMVPVLETLEADHDFHLSAWELITAPNALRRLDRDKDGPLRALIFAADRNQDGVSTAAELAQELRIREEGKRQLDRAVASGRK